MLVLHTIAANIIHLLAKFSILEINFLSGDLFVEMIRWLLFIDQRWFDNQVWWQWWWFEGSSKTLRVIHKMNGGWCTADIGDALVKAALGRVPQSPPPLGKTCCKFYPPPCVKPKLGKKFGRRNGQKCAPPTKKWRESQRSLDDCPPAPPLQCWDVDIVQDGGVMLNSSKPIFIENVFKIW